jgi:flagellar basal-body rod protein FlgB
MDLNAIPLFSMLKSKMTHTAERQRVISLNIANSDLPDYMPKDLKPFTFDQQMSSMQAGPPMALARTEPGHFELIDTTPPPALTSTDAPDSEVSLDGNHVVLEEQMVKMSDAQGDYAAAVSYYEQSLSLLKMAVSKPGG